METITRTPPFVSGLPVVGNALEFARRPLDLLQRGYRTHGEIFAIKLGNKPAAVLLGPENHDTFFSLSDKNLSLREAYRFLIPMFGEVLFTTPTHDEYLEQRRIISPVLSGRKMGSYIEAMELEMRDWIATAGDEGTFELNDFAAMITMFTAARCFMGDEFRQRVGQEFADLYRDIAGGIDFLLPPNLPLRKFRVRDRAKAQMSALISDVVDHRRANADRYDDFLQTLVSAELKNGEPMPTETIINIIIGLVFAGYETTSSHLSWGLVNLLEHPDYLATVNEEVDRVLAETDAFNAATIRSLERLNWALLETERLQPAAGMLMRYVREGYDVGPYHVPEGWLTMISPGVSHRLGRVYTNPNDYDPERFSPERAEHKQHQYALCGFGGGTHKCWGMSFAYNEMTVIIAMLLREFELSMAIPAVPDHGQQITRPLAPCTIQYTRRAH